MFMSYSVNLDQWAARVAPTLDAEGWEEGVNHPHVSGSEVAALIAYRDKVAASLVTYERKVLASLVSDSLEWGAAVGQALEVLSAALLATTYPHTPWYATDFGREVDRVLREGSGR